MNIFSRLDNLTDLTTNEQTLPSENAIEIHGITTTDVVKPGVVTEF